MIDRILQKLDQITQIKQLIKEAIVNRGIIIAPNESFKRYASKINLISGGLVEKLNPSNLNGLALWIDATCNTRNGFDSTKPYVEPIFIAPNDIETTVNYAAYYQSKTSGSWDGKFLNLGSKGAFKLLYNFHNDPMTIELVYKVVSLPVNAGFRVFHNNKLAYVINTAISEDTGETIMNAAYGSNPMHIVELGVPYYDVIQYDSTNGIRVITKQLNFDYTNTSTTIATPTSSVYLGFSTNGTTSSAFNATYTYSEGLQFGMCRCWNRLLSDYEITNNYYQDFIPRFVNS